jgi:hypothetical protein
VPDTEDIANALIGGFNLDDVDLIDDEPMEDMRSGGHFFEIRTFEGKTFTVVVTELGA